MQDAEIVQDDHEGIRKKDIIKDRTRGASKSYREPGDVEGIPLKRN